MRASSPTGRALRWHHGVVRPLSRHHPDRPALITEAPINAKDEFDRRRKRYLVMMTLRAACIIGAASTFRISGWLAAFFVVGALVLPWSAVLIANDRPPKQELRFRRFLGGKADTPKELTGRTETRRTEEMRTEGMRTEEGRVDPPVTPTVIDI